MTADEENRRTDDEELCRRVAYVMGEFSAAANAIKDLESKRNTGLRARVKRLGHTWIVETLGTLP